MERKLSASLDTVLVHAATAPDLPLSGHLAVPHSSRGKRAESRGSYLDFDAPLNRSSTLTLTHQSRPHHTVTTQAEIATMPEHRGELSISEKYNYVLSKAQLKASSNTSALLAGFAMVCLVELQYDEDTPHGLLIVLGVVTALLVSVHLLALMMSTCILPYMEAAGATPDSPHIKLKFYIDLSWLFSTCIGLILFLVEIGLIFYVKFRAIGFEQAGWITSAILIPVLFVFVMISCFIHRSRANYSIERIDSKVSDLKHLMDARDPNIALLKTV